MRYETGYATSFGLALRRTDFMGVEGKARRSLAGMGRE
jgi:hypothetical protein